MAKFPLEQFMGFARALRIDSKERGLMRLGDSLLGTQRWVLEKIVRGLEEGRHEFVTLKCLHPDTRVLRSNLRWVAIRNVCPGDELVAFDENKGVSGERRMRTAVVKAKWSSLQKSVLIRFTDGRKVIATGDHRFLCQTWGGTVLVWKPVSKMRVGEKIRTVVNPWDDVAEFDDGWMGGIIDGEGHLRKAGVSGVGVGITQTEGKVLDRIHRYLDDRGYHYNLHVDERVPGKNSKLGNKPCHRLTVHRMGEAMRLLGTTRPSRMIESPWWEGKGLPGKKIPGLAFAEISSIEPLHEQEMVDIETTTGTFIAEGLASHNCRQAGISTISLALDLFWLFRHRGMTGVLAVHEDTARDQFRSTLELYYSSLPDEWRRPIRDHNRNQLVLTSGTKLLYRVAGTRKTGKGSLGRSSAPSFLHATEMSSWGDVEGFASLRASLAQKNENRLYHWESTARGFENLFYDQWEEAKQAASMEAIFVSWWANEMYRIGEDDPLYSVYWGASGRMTPEEKAWSREVRMLYGFEIEDEQLAWYRWLAAEQQQDEQLRLQEYPWTETQAFQSSGSQFFSAGELSRLYTEVNKRRHPDYYRITYRDEFTQTQIVSCTAKQATLKVWEQPEERGFYVLGADPAYGSSERADSFCLSVWRVWSDKAIQVAEYTDYAITTAQFAWAIAYLCGAYGPCTFNLEVSGPGHAVLNEIQNMRKERALGSSVNRPVLKDVLGSMRDFLYRKYDSIYGTPGAIHTQTSFQMKERMMNTYRDYVERKMADPRSKELVGEMANVTREAGSAPAAPAHRRDDRVIAAALAILAWNDQVRTKLMAQSLTYEQYQRTLEQRKAVTPGTQAVGERIVRDYFKKLGILQVKQDVISTGVRVYKPRKA